MPIADSHVLELALVIRVLEKEARSATHGEVTTLILRLYRVFLPHAFPPMKTSGQSEVARNASFTAEVTNKW